VAVGQEGAAQGLAEAAVAHFVDRKEERHQRDQREQEG
jgi:hypothetical protein